MRGVAQTLAHAVATQAAVELPVRLRAWDGSETGPAEAPLVVLKSRRALRRLLWRGPELALAQAYVTGELDVPGGVAEIGRGLRAVRTGAGTAARSGTRTGRGSSVVRLARSVPDVARLGARGVLGPAPAAPRSQARVEGHLHSVRRDRAVIRHHYDLSNDFYRLVLDPSMAYSCGLYDGEGDTLAEAQLRKVTSICDQLGIGEGSRLLDLGCGWGSLTLHAAAERGASVDAVTLSTAQVQWVQQRAAELGVSDRVDVSITDYRELPLRQYDAIASIEMGEHVGAANYSTYLEAMRDRLAPGARVLIQQMSRHADAAPGGGPFIESFIAPDMHMRPLPETLALLEASGLEVVAVRGMRDHYARTITDWLANLEARRGEAVALVGEEMVRVWELYLVGGAMAFADGRMGVDQVLATHSAGLVARPGSRSSVGLSAVGLSAVGLSATEADGRRFVGAAARATR